MTEKIIKANGIDIAYEEFGDRSNPTILLVMGLGAQMTLWPLSFCEGLVSQGYHVLRFDNRDVGLSEKFDHSGQPNMLLVGMGSFFGLPVPVPYSLTDMTEDAVGLLDALDIDAVHIVGASLGGMIAQLFAAHYPSRCLSLTSMMSSSGRLGLPSPKPKVFRQLMSRPMTNDMERRLAHGVKMYRLIGSPKFPTSEEDARTLIIESSRRSNYTFGYSRQLAAAFAGGSRIRLLRRIQAPSLVLHGKNDPLIPVAHGVDTARWIPRAQLEIIDGWGHDLPKPLVPRIVDMIAEHASGSKKAIRA
ncbi:alpha/beta hydrolase [Spongiibacter sp. KMU-166]|uniref:Alpha/beta hydrolase n=1 Tax=Spongiibacter thalassae TaxID=2721624 RepID=A0ABX1G9U3_9GAMM|nr:alpha/beta hydrolase [Spongiibacter thalassae]NKI15929.1 alpha/beta hydrolase [Spongiibacter thalassae]